MMVNFRSTPVSLRFARAAALAAVLFACALEARAEVEPTVASRGLSASIMHDASQGRVRARPDLPSNSPIYIRVGAPDAEGKQQIEFLGVTAGDFDLRDYLFYEDGTPLPASVSIPVRIVSHLPAGPDTDVARIERPSPELRRSYMVIAIVAGVLWALVPVAVIVRRALRRRGADAPPAMRAAPTIADEIRQLIAESRRRPLGVSQQGRMELLVLQFLQNEGLVERGSAGTPADQAVRLSELRTRPESRDLVLAIEAWLHQRPGDESARRADEAATALDAFQRSRLAQQDRPSVEVGG